MRTVLLGVVSVVATLGCGASDAALPAAAGAEHAEPRDPHASDEPVSDAHAPCAQLPVDAPAELWVQLSHHDSRRPETKRRWDVVSLERECPADELPAHLGYAPPTCVRLAPPALRSLFAQLRAHRIAELRVRPAAPTPHRSEHAIAVHWPGGECELSIAGSGSDMVREDTADFGAAVNAISAAVNAAR